MDPEDIARKIEQKLRDKLGDDRDVNIAAAINVGRSGTVSAYSDDDVTIVQRNGKTEVIRRRPADDHADRDDHEDKEDGPVS
jgi:hypothetical protein